MFQVVAMEAREPQEAQYGSRVRVCGAADGKVREGPGDHEGPLSGRARETGFTLGSRYP